MTHSKTPHFNLRVYGLLINSRSEVLVADEYVMSTYMTKFPGGGLEYGEGTLDCIRREMREELMVEIDVLSHFYTTDFFQAARFFEHTQLISIYYKIQFKHEPRISISTKKHDFEKVEGSMSFRWLPISGQLMDELTFPIDKVVAQKLISELH